MPTIHLHYFSTWNHFIEKDNSFSIYKNFIKSEQYKRQKPLCAMDHDNTPLDYNYLPIAVVDNRIILLFKEPFFNIEDLKKNFEKKFKEGCKLKNNAYSTKNQYRAYSLENSQPEIIIWQYEQIENDLSIQSKLIKLIEPITKKMSRYQKQNLKFTLYKDNQQIIINDDKNIAHFSFIINESKKTILKDHDHNPHNIHSILTQTLFSRVINKGNKNTLNIKDSDPVYKVYSEKKKRVYQRLITILTIGTIFILFSLYVGIGILTHGITLLLFPPLLKLSVVLGGGLVSYTVCGTLAGLTIISGAGTFTAIVISTCQYLYSFWKTPPKTTFNACQASERSSQTLRIDK